MPHAERRHLAKSWAALAAVAFSVAVSLAACELQDHMTQLGTRLATAKPEERAKALAETPPAVRETVVKYIYGADLMYLSPEAEAQLFATEENFIFGLFAGGWAKFKPMIETALRGPEREANTADIRKIADDLPGIWAANLAILKMSGNGLADRRADAIKQRLGKSKDRFGAMDEYALRDLIWDEEKFERFMADDAYAIDYTSRAVAKKEVSTTLLANFESKRSRIAYLMMQDGLGHAAGGSGRTGT